MIEPTPGRVVWYHPANEHDAKALSVSPGATLAAHVAYVHNSRLVNLMVIDTNGNPHSGTSVQLLQDDDKPMAGASYCEWMPYQKGQAANHS